ncbi:hypothetical protein COU15_00680 [Candidatus Kaiserbacteria bacterium CG10_big_fil_rev_8_21_14_0_10_45_20]|uniref:Uncharacterized protein n=1 Tax=Candidatus Kaiserbacteria bacterium CG10_big_fil_rev_8_21_14_0_10_45_20 TaxID=1974607 RepID=A0A2H0UGB0_9BACT|nr:MAG: hypothetical protein COU15_00680 [Candidatus Kaiserbacteria bacterium CG10_big_fil_rev_8_21_14_0_10_45_20]
MEFILWAVFWLGLVITAGYAFALVYHWLRYGHMYPAVWVALPVYAIGVFLFIGAMLGGISTL